MNYYKLFYELDEPKFKGLSDSAKLLYCRLAALAEGDLSKKLKGASMSSNEYLLEKTGWSKNKLGRVLKELESWNIINRTYVKSGVTKTTRFIKALPLEYAIAPSTTTECTSAKKALPQNEPSTTTECTEALPQNEPSTTPNCGSIINKVIDKSINKLTDKVTTYEVDEDLKGDIRNYWKVKYSGWETQLSTLSRNQQKELHEFLRTTVTNQRRISINDVIQNKLYKKGFSTFEPKVWVPTNDPYSQDNSVKQKTELTLG